MHWNENLHPIVPDLWCYQDPTSEYYLWCVSSSQWATAVRLFLSTFNSNLAHYSQTTKALSVHSGAHSSEWWIFPITLLSIQVSGKHRPMEAASEKPCSCVCLTPRVLGNINDSTKTSKLTGKVRNPKSNNNKTNLQDTVAYARHGAAAWCLSSGPWVLSPATAAYKGNETVSTLCCIRLMRGICEVCEGNYPVGLWVHKDPVIDKNCKQPHPWPSLCMHRPSSFNFPLGLWLGNVIQIICFNNRSAWNNGWEIARKRCYLMQKSFFPISSGSCHCCGRQCRNVEAERSNWASPPRLWVFQINILTVVFMMAGPRESDPTERKCPAGGTLWDTVNGTCERKLKLVLHREEVCMEYQMCVIGDAEAPANRNHHTALCPRYWDYNCCM